MKKTITAFGTVVLTADENMVLQRKDGGISKEFFLAKSDTENDYIEISEDSIPQPTEEVEEVVEEVVADDAIVEDVEFIQVEDNNDENNNSI